MKDVLFDGPYSEVNEKACSTRNSVIHIYEIMTMVYLVVENVTNSQKYF